MATDSTFRGIIEFFNELGIYDVILPFLLIFTIIFAILEKTKLLGTEEGEPKKNLDAMIAFVVSFLVVASTRLVAALNEAVANIAMMMVVLFSFLMLIATFYKEGDEVEIKEGVWRNVFMIIVLVAVVLIFLDALTREDGDTWLEYSWDYLSDHYDTNFVGSIILLIVLVVLMIVITKSPKEGGGNSQDSEEG